jgi:hypothetical protein
MLDCTWSGNDWISSLLSKSTLLYVAESISPPLFCLIAWIRFFKNVTSSKSESNSSVWSRFASCYWTPLSFRSSIMPPVSSLGKGGHTFGWSNSLDMYCLRSQLYFWSNPNGQTRTGVHNQIFRSLGIIFEFLKDFRYAVNAIGPSSMLHCYWFATASNESLLGLYLSDKISLSWWSVSGFESVLTF